MNIPEPPLDPPEAFYIEDSNGCEVYEGEIMYELDSEDLCADCLIEKVRELSVAEVAELFGAISRTVERRYARDEF